MHERPGKPISEAAGFSLIELLVVVGIIAVLVAIAGLQYSRLVIRYNVEREIREMQMDILNGRTRAMGRNRMHFFTWDGNSYVLYEDTNPRPDGNGTLEIASDAKIVQKNLRYAVTWTSPNKTIRLTAGGLVPPTDLSNSEAIPDASIRVASSTGADYDCIIIGETRTNIGRWNGTNCQAR